MAEITVPRNTFELGEFPPVCCKTGEHATVYNRWFFNGRRFAGVLPTSAKVLRRTMLLRRAFSLLAIAGAVTVALGLFASPSIVLLGLALGGAALLAMTAVWFISPGARLSDTTVRLTRVHANFVEAVQRPPLPSA